MLLTDPDIRQTLLDLARGSIEQGLSDRRLLVESCEYPAVLQAQGASFVTLNLNDKLRGCIGTLKAYQSLAIDVVEHAYAAAFQDPRFSPLTLDEFTDIEIHISVLGKPETVIFSSEQDLVEKLRPGTDGLILEEGAFRGTFLPTVWESLPDPRLFLAQLKRKAGLPADYWSDTIAVKRYTTESIS